MKKHLFVIILIVSFSSVCLSQSLEVSLGEITPAGNNNIACQNLYEDPFFLPDGSGVTYMDSIVVSGMPEGMVILDTLDISSFIMNIEHSYTGDLDIYLLCPSGQSLSIFEQYGGGANFGEALDDEGLAPGNGYNYVFSPNFNTYGTLWDTIPAYNTPYPSGSYLPLDSWTNLVGCPVNGVWKLEVMDNIGIDNGYIFHWGLYFNEIYIPDGYNEGAAEIEVTGGIPPYEFQWSNGSQEQNLTHAAPGTYWVTVTDSGRSTDTVVLKLDIPIVVHEEEWITDQKVSIYPNPAKDFINVELPNAENYNITLVNALGGIILTRSFSGDAYKLNLTELTSGVYYLKVENDSFREIRKIRVE